MASRTIAIKISVDSASAVKATQDQTNAMRGLGLEQQKISQLQEGLTNSFIRGNLAARAISMGFMAMKDATTFVVGGLANLELTLARVQATTGASTATTDALSATIFKLGRETSSSVSDISKASLELAKLGFSGKDLEVVLGGVSRLSSVLGDSLEATGQLVGGVVNTFDLSASQAAQVADKLFVATGKSAASIESFKVAFGLAGNVASNAGVSFEELAAVIATLSNQGIRASTIGTGLRTFVTNLSMEGSNAQKVLGGSFEEMGLLGAMEKMAQVKPGTGTIFDMFGKPGSPVASAMMNSTDMYKEFLGAVQTGNGSLLTAGNVINETLIGSITRLNNALLEVSATLVKGFGGSGELNFFGKMAEQIGFLTDKMNEARRFEEFIKSHAKKAGGVGSGFASAGEELGVPREGNQNYSEAVKQAFHRREEADRVKAAASKLVQDRVAQKLLDDAKANMVGSNRNLKAEEDAAKVAENLAKQARKAEDAQRERTDALIRKEAGPAGPISPNEDWSLYDPLNWKGGADPFSDKGKKNLVGDMTDEITDGWAKANESVAKFNQTMEQNEFAFLASKVAMESLNGSVDILSHYFIEGIFSDKRAPFKHISDAFGDFAKKMAADLVALSIKILVFRGLIAGLGLIPGGAAAIPFANVLATATTGVKFASGTDQIVTKPTLFMAGESGRERVSVTPRAKMGSGGGSITVNIQGDVMDGAKFTEAVEMAQKKLRGRNV